MPKTHVPYSPEFRRQTVALARAGRDPDDLAREFEPTAQSICNWIMQADKKEGRREDVLPGLSVRQAMRRGRCSALDGIRGRRLR